MDFLADLWLPILASAAAVWIASAVGWMFIGHHCKDSVGLPAEDEKLNQIRAWNLPPGAYLFPHFEKSEAHSPEAQAKWKQGPTGMLRVWGKVSMGKNMALTFLTLLVVSTLIAYLAAAIPLPHGAEFTKVFRITGTAGILAYVFANIPTDIWFQQTRRAIITHTIDGIVFGLITGAVFAALWPSA